MRRQATSTARGEAEVCEAGSFSIQRYMQVCADVPVGGEGKSGGRLVIAMASGSRIHLQAAG